MMSDGGQEVPSQDRLIKTIGDYAEVLDLLAQELLTHGAITANGFHDALEDHWELLPESLQGVIA